MKNLPRALPTSLPAELVQRLDTMTYGGEALGRHEGKAIFVTGGLAGELARIVVEDDRARFARGRVVEIIEPSPDLFPHTYHIETVALLRRVNRAIL